MTRSGKPWKARPYLRHSRRRFCPRALYLLAALVVVAAVASAFQGHVSPIEPGPPSNVARIVDGDTIYVRINGQTFDAREKLTTYAWQK